MEAGAVGFPVGPSAGERISAAVHPVNMLLETNYGFTVATPAGGSVLDLFGPWPWYLLWMQIPALVLMYLLTLPFRHYPRGRTGSSLFHH